MTIAQELLTTQILLDTIEGFPSGSWGSYSESISPVEFQDGFYEGNYQNWGCFNTNTTLNLFQSPTYAGYTTNFGGIQETTMLNSFSNGAYAGYTTNFGGQNVSTIPDFTVVDYNSVIDHPKDQFLYYKLKGFNTITQTYETWIEKEDITARPELFDAGRNPPTIERDVNRIAPSGNALVNITIVARWIQ